MDKFITIQDAIDWITIISVFIIPWAISKLKNVTWPGIYKYLIAVGFSLVLGILQSYADGKLLTDSTILSNAGAIFLAAHTVYQVFFKHLGWEQYVNPQEALVTKASEQVRQEIAKIPDQEAKAILDPRLPPELDIQITKRS